MKMPELCAGGLEQGACMKITVGEAQSLECPIGFAGGAVVACIANRCPVWRWENMPHVEIYTGLLREAEGLDKAYRSASKEERQILLMEKPAIELFHKPSGDGWINDSTPVSRENNTSGGVWHLRWTRSQDLEVKGYCGLGGKADY
jgi:hypothetical protein